MSIFHSAEQKMCCSDIFYNQISLCLIAVCLAPPHKSWRKERTCFLPCLSETLEAASGGFQLRENLCRTCVCCSSRSREPARRRATAASMVASGYCKGTSKL